MKSTLNCPECGKGLSTRAERCRCGWKLPVANPGESRADGRCEYFVREHRCLLPGSLCRYPYSKGPWYCAGHLNCLDNPQQGEAALRHAEANYGAIMAERQDWRDVMLSQRLSSKKN